MKIKILHQLILKESSLVCSESTIATETPSGAEEEEALLPISIQLDPQAHALHSTHALR